jgi:Txe/YoeB family toxin of Txe-Axe toxin-antitoxin module
MRNLTEKQIEQLKTIELIEQKYLNKYFYFLKYVEDEMMVGFQTKEKIKDDWFGKYDSKISNFAVGAERIIYALFNGKSVGQQILSSWSRYVF